MVNAAPRVGWNDTPSVGTERTAYGMTAVEDPDDPVTKRRREAATRAFDEAAARRTQTETSERPTALSIEKFGRDGPDPVRYGDWEVKGIATDF